MPFVLGLSNFTPFKSKTCKFNKNKKHETPAPLVVKLACPQVELGHYNSLSYKCYKTVYSRTLMFPVKVLLTSVTPDLP